MNIYPKLDKNLNGLKELEKYIKEYKGVELQFFHEDGVWGKYDFNTAINTLMKKIPSIKEITIHPPLDDYDIELVVLKDRKILETKIEEALKISEQYNIKINLLYHVGWTMKMMEQGAIEIIEKSLNLLKETNVNIILENTFGMNEYKQKCTVIEVCKKINNPHLKACIDVCHLHCMANIFKMNFDSFMKSYIEKDQASKYVYQIHFSDTKSNDGYINKENHGRKHDSLSETLQDYNILKLYNMTNANIITEISENNYNTRKDQAGEIKLLEKISEHRNKKTLDF